jgi:hypothetical protein
MNKMMNIAIILILTAMTQVTFAQVSGQDVQYAPPRQPNPPPRIPRRLYWVSLGEAKTNKIITNNFRFYPRTNEPVWAIRVVGTNSPTQIQSFKVRFNDGEVIELYQLEGQLEQGRAYAARIDYRYIEEIDVAATSGSLTGGRGRFRVDIAIVR